MRYFLDKAFKSELESREIYLYEALHLYTLSKPYDSNFLQLASVPSNTLNVCFIVGHNYNVKHLLENNLIQEKEIIAITCDGISHFREINLPGKNLYIANQEQYNLAYLYNGKQFGFDFDLTESEILFYNSSKTLPIVKRLDECFTKL